MANKNKNTNEIVADDDITAELQELTLQQVLTRSADDELLEDDANTFEFERKPGRQVGSDVEVLRSDLKSHSNTIGRMQYELEQLRSKWQGLQSETRARAAIGDELNRQVGELREALERKNRLLQQRDRSIKSLKTEIRQREAAHHELGEDNERLTIERERLEAELGEQHGTIGALREESASRSSEITALQRELQQREENAEDRRTRPDRARRDGSADSAPAPDFEATSGAAAESRARIAELAAQLERRESYANGVRQKLEDQTKRSEQLEQSELHLTLEVDEYHARQIALTGQIERMGNDNRALGEQIAAMQHRHTDEIQELRSELEAVLAQAARQESANADLAAELLESKNYREQFEQMLNRNDGRFREQIAELEQRNANLEAQHQSLEQKLANKTAAVSCLLAELASQNEDAQTMAELSDTTVVDIDNHLADSADLQRDARDGDRVNRMLIG
ncbi:MAG: hypothetical protein AAGE85_15840, partial [Pseudomonadota bacterium]